MDVEQLRQDAREGRVKLDRLVELIVALQRQLAEADARIRELEAALDELGKQASSRAKNRRRVFRESGREAAGRAGTEVQEEETPAPRAAPDGR